MNIGTGKIAKKEMRGIPHHLIDVASPKRVYTVVDYKQDAERALKDILRRRKLPIVCGGTGFYISALVDALLLPDVKPDPVLRKRLEKKSTQELFTILKKLDPRRARAIDAKNPRRLIRAIEIAKALGGIPPLKRQNPYDPLFIGINIPSEKLHKRIHLRLIARMKAGMLSEAQRLHREGVSWKRMEALGLEYKYLAYYLQKKIAKKEMLARLEVAIRHYAKRQMTWFKKDRRIHWIGRERARTVRLVKKFLHKDSVVRRSMTKHQKTLSLLKEAG
jgi:tRNA dimethylallyltransferase